MQGICEHSRSEIIAKRDGVDYLRCVQCGQVFEADDLEPAPLLDGEDEGEDLLE